MSKIPVRNGLGRVVGHVIGNRLYKKVSASRHKLRQPEGWAWDRRILQQATEAGATVTEIYDTDSGRTYYARISDFDSYGVAVNRGFGEQICLPMDYWQLSPPAEQIRMGF